MLTVTCKTETAREMLASHPITCKYFGDVEMLIQQNNPHDSCEITLGFGVVVAPGMRLHPERPALCSVQFVIRGS